MGCSKSKFSGPIRTIANLQPRKKLTFHQHQIGGHKQQGDQDDAQFND